jgi:hypothetical protein
MWIPNSCVVGSVRSFDGHVYNVPTILRFAQSDPTRQ